MTLPEWADLSLMIAATAASVCLIIGVGLAALAIGIFVLKLAIKFWRKT